MKVIIAILLIVFIGLNTLETNGTLEGFIGFSLICIYVLYNLN